MAEEKKMGIEVYFLVMDWCLREFRNMIKTKEDERLYDSCYIPAKITFDKIKKMVREGDIEPKRPKV